MIAELEKSKVKPSGLDRFPLRLAYARHWGTEYIDPESGAEGRRGVLTVFHDRTTKDGAATRSEVFIRAPTIERGNGYARMKPGVYTVKMVMYTPRSGGSPRPALRVLQMPVRVWKNWGRERRLVTQYRDTLLFHAAHAPGALQGCVAPGVYASDRGVASSVEAMSAIFETLGGFYSGRTFQLEVWEVKA